MKRSIKHVKYACMSRATTGRVFFQLVFNPPVQAHSTSIFNSFALARPMSDSAPSDSERESVSPSDSDENDRSKDFDYSILLRHQNVNVQPLESLPDDATLHDTWCHLRPPRVQPILDTNGDVRNIDELCRSLIVSFVRIPREDIVNHPNFIWGGACSVFNVFKVLARLLKPNVVYNNRPLDKDHYRGFRGS